MNKYRVYYKESAQNKYSATIDVIFGYSEEDALKRHRIKRSEIEGIYQIYV